MADKIMTVRINSELFRQAKEKAGAFHLAAVIRRLVEMWVAGEIEITIGENT